jgi:molybdopterin synthase catalytic subunit/molybdopterin converting factor small subunit
MKITLLAFATASQALGCRELDFELPDQSRLEDLHQSLVERYPDLVPLWPRLAIAINGKIAQPDSLLPPDAEVALLPPVSGGSSPRAELVDRPIDVAALVADVSATSCGAVVTFVGTVRDHHENRPVNKIHYDAYRPMALSALQDIAMTLGECSSELRTRIVHRLGEVPAGEASVVIVIASPHRAAAYEASREALERIKCEVPIWKEEHYSDGSKMWREEEALGDRRKSDSQKPSAP